MDSVQELEKLPDDVEKDTATSAGMFDRVFAGAPYESPGTAA